MYMFTVGTAGLHKYFFCDKIFNGIILLIVINCLSRLRIR